MGLLVIRRALAVLLLCSAGCGTLNPSYEGVVDSAQHPSGVHNVNLWADDFGNLCVMPVGETREGTYDPRTGKHDWHVTRLPLTLPTAREDRRFGVTAVELSVPPMWRPRGVSRGAIMVTAVSKSSPLAEAGLRPFDLVRALNRKPVKDPAAFVAALEAVTEGATVELEIVRGAVWARVPMRIHARAGALIGDTNEVYVPTLFEHRTSRLGSALAVGPLDGLFWYRDAFVDGTHRELEWASLINVIKYTVVYPDSTETEWKRNPTASWHPTRELRIFWFIPISV